MARHRPPPPPLSNEHRDDVAELLASSGGFEASLTLAEKILIDRATTAQIFSEECAAEISLVWTTIQQRGKDHPQALRSFRNRVEERIRGITGRSLENWIALGFETMQRSERCAETIRQHWGCEPMQVLPPEKYSGERPLSRQILKELADLSTLVSAGEGRQILLAEIEKRAQPGRDVKTRSYQAFLTLSAVKEAVTVAKSQRSKGTTGLKRKRVEPPHAAYTPQDTPQTTPRKKKATVKQQALDETPRPRLAPVASPRGPEGHHEIIDTVDGLGSGGDGSGISAKIGQHTEPLEVDLSTMLEDVYTILEEQESDMSAEVGRHAEPLQAGLSTVEEREENLDYDDSAPLFRGDVLLSQSSPLLPRSMTIDQPCQPSPGSRMHSSSMASVPNSPRKVQGDGNPTNREARASPEPLTGTATKEQMAESEDGLTQAIATLESGQRLSSTAIYEVLDACAPSHCHVVDPLFVDPKFRSTQRRRVKSLGDGVSTVFVPLHDPEHQHWTLVVLRREDSTAHHFDSCRSVDTIIDVKALNGCMEQLDEQYESKDIILAECPQQDNDFDCGVEVIANALCQMTGITALPIRNCDVWRPICKALISQKVAQPAAGSDLGYDLASLLCDKTLGAEDERRHQLARDILKKLQSKREQVNSEKCEAVHIEIVLAKLIQSNSQTITSLESELEAVKVSAEALYKDFEASNQQYSQLIPKYFIPDHRPALRKTLEAVKAIECKLQRRLQRLQTSTTKLNIARMTLESFHEMYVTIQVQLDEDQESMEGAVRAWRDEATARAERARHTLTLFKEAR